MRLLVTNPARLARYCDQIARWEGSQLVAARRLDIGVGQFNRLLRKRGGHALNGRVWQRLEHYLPPDHVTSIRLVRRWEADLEAAVMTPAATKAFDGYVAWLRRELRRFTKSWRDGWPRYRRGGGDRYSRCLHLVWRLRNRFPGHFSGLETVAKVIAKSRGWAPGRERLMTEKTVKVNPKFRTLAEVREQERLWGHRWFLTTTERLRLELAHLRVVEPLLASEEAAGIEMQVDDLGEEDLRSYLGAAVRREVVLLRRAADLQRAQKRAVDLKVSTGISSITQTK
jgi:hypothetical protein